MKRLMTIAVTLAALALPMTAQAQAPAVPAAPKPPTAATAATPAKPAVPAPAATTGEPIDINTATVPELLTLPGIGAAYSAAIVKGRPYTRKDQLVSKGIVPQATYDGIKEKVVAKQKAS
jgi:DNA uptake protein ComE-like DNA-binding protein